MNEHDKLILHNICNALQIILFKTQKLELDSPDYPMLLLTAQAMGESVKKLKLRNEGSIEQIKKEYTPKIKKIIPITQDLDIKVHNSWQTILTNLNAV